MWVHMGVSPVKASTANSVGKGNGDTLKSVGDGVNDISHAVNTADQAAHVVDTAKKAFGL